MYNKVRPLKSAALGGHLRLEPGLHSTVGGKVSSGINTFTWLIYNICFLQEAREFTDRLRFLDFSIAPAQDIKRKGLW